MTEIKSEVIRSNQGLLSWGQVCPVQAVGGTLQRVHSHKANITAPVITILYVSSKCYVASTGFSCHLNTFTPIPTHEDTEAQQTQGI